MNLADVQRGESGLTCYTCDDNIVVKDGRGRFVHGQGRRNQKRRKHFSHTANSQCHGEGPAHFRIKNALCWSINNALTTPEQQRKLTGILWYRCPNPTYGLQEIFKFAPPVKSDPNQQFQQLQLGYHEYDLLHVRTRYWQSGRPALQQAKTEVWLDGRRTRADIAGLDKDGNPIWVIELRRTGHVSQAAIDYALETGIPLFVIDLTHLPSPTPGNPYAEITCNDYRLVDENLSSGSYPRSDENYNLVCPRQAFGMGPRDQHWQKQNVLLHRGTGQCLETSACPGCEEVTLHECGEALCPDSSYMFENDIGVCEMYLDPEHRKHSHIQPDDESARSAP